MTSVHVRNLALLLLILVSLPRAGQSTQDLHSNLFAPAHSSDIHVPPAERGTAQFLEMNRGQFAALASWKEFTCVIPNFPLASDGKCNLRVEQFDAVSKDVKGMYPVPQHVFFRGSVDGISESHVCLTLYDDCAWGYITAGGRTYSIHSTGRTELGNLILGVEHDSTKADGFACGMDEVRKCTISEAVRQTLKSGTHPLSPDKIFSAPIPQFTVGIEIDSPCVKLCGGTPVSAFKYALALLAAASDVYIRDAGIALVCSTHYEWATTDPYSNTTACQVLDEFNGTYLPGPRPCIVSLFSGRPTDWCGGVAAGIGMLNQPDYSKCVLGIKNSSKKNGWDYPYQFFTWDIMVATHEMGHLIACPHTHNCVWDPPLDSCVEAEPIWPDPPCYDNPVPRTGTIMSYCHTTLAGAILKFHPRCIDLIEQTIPAYSCGATVDQPRMTIGPQRIIHECAGGAYKFTLTGSGSVAPYSFEINPTPDSLYASGNGYTVVLNPFKTQTFYVRVTDGASVRSYDSILFLPLSSTTVKIRVDSSTIPADSAILHAELADSTGVFYYWYKLPIGLGTVLSTHSAMSVARKEALQYSVKILTPGGCILRDTLALSAHTPTGGVDYEAPAHYCVYPNPAMNTITVVLPSALSHSWIEDVLGRRIIVRSSLSGDMQSRMEFDVSRLAVGTYWIVSESSGRLHTTAFQKQ